MSDGAVVVRTAVAPAAVVPTVLPKFLAVFPVSTSSPGAATSVATVVGTGDRSRG